MSTSTQHRVRRPAPPLVLELALAGVSAAVAVSFARLFRDWAFLGRVLGFALAAHAVAALGRRLRWPLPVALLASAAGALTAVGLAFHRPLTALGVLPTRAVWDAAGADLSAAWTRFGEAVAPVESERGFVLAAALGLWFVATLADALAFRAGTLLEALVPAGTAFVFAAVLAAERWRLPSAALLLGTALAFLLAARLHRDLGRSGWLGDRVASRRVLARGAVAVGLAVIGAAVLGPAVPGAGEEALVDWREGGDSRRVTVSPLVDISGRLVSQSEVEVFRVRASDASYWRLTSLDTFDGSIWSSEGTYRPAGGELPTTGGTSSSQVVVQEIEILGLSSIWLPAAFTPIELVGGDEVRFDPASATLVTGRDTVDGQSYRVTSALPRFDSPQELAAVARRPIPPDVQRYLQLPGPLPAEVLVEARAATAGIGNDPYALALALQTYFRGFQYDQSVRAGHGEDAMVSFLSQRRGYCEQFAGTFAAMARGLGIPARVAVGFTPGDLLPDGTGWSVRGRHAHAWPEVWLGDAGWVAFEPTPGRGPPGAEGYTGVPPDQADPESGDGSAPTTAPPGPGGPVPAPSIALPDDVLGPQDVGAGAAPITEGPDDPGPSVGGRLLLGLAALAGLGALAVAAVPVLRALLRRRRRAAATTPDARTLVAWAEAAEAFALAGVARAPAETEREYTARVADRLGLGRGRLRELAEAAELVRFAPGLAADDVARRAEERSAEAIAALRSGATWRTRLRWALDPRPLRPDHPARREVAERVQR